mmetsp:Transcript_67252/g.186302  ORF Transcript_67252/g.186302 Transcript_67252/m.186302 type:complete len:291 (-) Transcript_67252:99-971(-)
MPRLRNDSIVVVETNELVSSSATRAAAPVPAVRLDLLAAPGGASSRRELSFSASSLPEASSASSLREWFIFSASSFPEAWQLGASGGASFPAGAGIFRSWSLSSASALFRASMVVWLSTAEKLGTLHANLLAAMKCTFCCNWDSMMAVRSCCTCPCISENCASRPRFCSASAARRAWTASVGPEAAPACCTPEAIMARQSLLMQATSCFNACTCACTLCTTPFRFKASLILASTFESSFSTRSLTICSTRLIMTDSLLSSDFCDPSLSSRRLCSLSSLLDVERSTGLVLS